MLPLDVIRVVILSIVAVQKPSNERQKVLLIACKQVKLNRTSLTGKINGVNIKRHKMDREKGLRIFGEVT